MSTEAKAAAVLAAVRDQAAEWPPPIEVTYRFLAAVAKSLHLDFSGGDPLARKDWAKFTGQVRRALKALADDGTLVKGRNGRGTYYRTLADAVGPAEAWEGGGYGGAGPMDTWTVYASSGEYPVPAESAGHAFLRFTDRHPDDFVCAIVSDAMRPRLILEDGE